MLARVLPAGARVLEIASGSGEHAAWLAPRLAVTAWQPTDPDPDARASIDAWRAHAPDPRVLPARALEVHARPWPVAAADAIVCINMVHIAPFSACAALFAGAAELSGSPVGMIFLYGPFKRDGAHTAPSNAAFDESLRARDPAWGVRDLAAVVAVAAASGFVLVEEVAMPANNLSLIFRPRP